MPPHHRLTSLLPRRRARRTTQGATSDESQRSLDSAHEVYRRRFHISADDTDSTHQNNHAIVDQVRDATPGDAERGSGGRARCVGVEDGRSAVLGQENGVCLSEGRDGASII